MQIVFSELTALKLSFPFTNKSNHTLELPRTGDLCLVNVGEPHTGMCECVVHGKDFISLLPPCTKKSLANLDNLLHALFI